MFNYIINSLPLALLAGAVLILLDFSYLRYAIKKIKDGRNASFAPLVGMISFLVVVYIAVIVGNLLYSKYGSSAFSLALGTGLVLIGLICYFLEFFTARKDIKKEKITNKQALEKYFDKNAVLGFAMGHYMFGVIMLIVGGMGSIFNPIIFSILPHNMIGAILGFAAMILYVFVLPMFLIAKTPTWFRNAVGKVKK